MLAQAFPATKGPVLLVTAHPDDEVMFFSPLLSEMSSEEGEGGSRIHILCLSSGNQDGLGAERRLELERCCGLYDIPASHICVVEHPDLQDGMRNHWPTDVIAGLFLAHLSLIQPELVVTFDEYGVSGHINHIATSRGVRLGVLQAREQGRAVTALQLCSKNALRKFSGLLDAFATLLCDEMVILNRDPLRTLAGLRAHSSQSQLYRQAFVLCSSFTYIVSFQLID